MPDMRAILGDIAALLRVGVRSFVLTSLLMLLLGAVLAALSYWIFSGHHWVYGLIFALVALIECIVVGFVLAAKRAIAVTLNHGLRRYQLGGAAIRLIFDRLLGVTAEEAHGERGGWMTKTAERLPLAQAETRLQEAIRAHLHAPAVDGGASGWLRRRLQARLLGAIHKYTLARFRDEDAQHGGVDLVRVRDDLGERINGMLLSKLRGGINVWTAAVLIGLPVQVLALDYIVLAFLK